MSTRLNLRLGQRLGLMAAVGLSMIARAADVPAPVVYMDAAKVAEALAKTGLITSNAEFMVAGAHREKPGQVELHEKTTDILFVVDGEALYVTGGKMVDGKQTRPGEWIGANIEGGVEHHLKKGDVIVVPPNTPHWFKEVTLCNSFMVRVNQP
ncbi:MAG TPA: cupin domain-containing protein [Bryobacteraceae bacterium]|nr:cupin domain-containing protein [Bryobacteraceae bacterium]